MFLVKSLPYRPGLTHFCTLISNVIKRYNLLCQFQAIKIIYAGLFPKSTTNCNSFRSQISFFELTNNSVRKTLLQKECVYIYYHELRMCSLKEVQIYGRPPKSLFSLWLHMIPFCSTVKIMISS